MTSAYIINGQKKLERLTKLLSRERQQNATANTEGLAALNEREDWQVAPDLLRSILTDNMKLKDAVLAKMISNIETIRVPPPLDRERFSKEVFKALLQAARTSDVHPDYYSIISSRERVNDLSRPSARNIATRLVRTGVPEGCIAVAFQVNLRFLQTPGLAKARLATGIMPCITSLLNTFYLATTEKSNVPQNSKEFNSFMAGMNALLNGMIQDEIVGRA